MQSARFYKGIHSSKCTTLKRAFFCCCAKHSSIFVFSWIYSGKTINQIKFHTLLLKKSLQYDRPH